MPDSYLQECFAERIGGRQYGKSGAIYKFEKIKRAKRAALAAVCHEDATGRLHTVKPSQNALYYDLIKTFSRKSGTPVVLNTSFNENEPIVDTPRQAVDCFMRTDMDVLCLGPFVTTKAGKSIG